MRLMDFQTRPTCKVAARLSVLAVAGVLSVGSALSDPSQLKLRDDFAGDDFAPAGGLFYKDNAEQRAGAYRMRSGGVRSASNGLELSVVPQCRQEQRGCSERAEVWERPEVLADYGKTLWYAFSMKLDDPPPAASHRYVVAQWKRGIKPNAKGDYSPFLAIRIIRGQLALTIDSDAMPSRKRDGGDAPLACASDAAPAQQRGEARQTRILVTASPSARPEQFGGYDSCATDVKIIRRGGAMPKADSNWINFVFKVRPGPHGDGEIEAFANGSWIASVRGRIGHDGPELRENQYFKFGPYRDGGQTDRWRVFYDAFRRGPACEDVADAAVCSQLKGS